MLAITKVRYVVLAISNVTMSELEGTLKIQGVGETVSEKKHIEENVQVWNKIKRTQTTTDSTGNKVLEQNCQVLQVFVNFLCLTVAFEQTTQHSHTSYPNNLLWHTGICCTLALARASVSTFASCKSVLADTCTRMHSHRFSDNQTIFNEFTDVLSWKAYKK